MRSGRGERGAGTLLTALVGVLGVCLAVAVASFGALRAAVDRLEGAADLAALAGAQAQAGNREACAAARASAAANVGTVTRCEVVGDEVEFVVRVWLEAPAALWPVGVGGTLTSHANAGVVTGAPAGDAPVEGAPG